MGERLGFGATAGIYAWGDDQVLKVFRPGMSESAVRHEAEATAVAHSLGLAVPAVGGMLEIDGRLGIVYERLTGPTLLQSLSASPWRMVQYARQLAELQAALHRCPAAGLPPLRPCLREHVERVVSLPESLKSQVLALLDSLPDGDRICHWDFHPDNVMLSERGPVVIDWMGAALGDASADLARTSVILRTSEVTAGRGSRILLRLVVGIFYRQYRRRYLQLAPTPAPLAAAWEVPVAAARLLEQRPKVEDERLKRIVLRGLAGCRR